MLQVVSNLKGFDIEAKDGPLGSVADFLFDDTTWKMRWMVVDTGKWLTGRKVLIHPSSIGHVGYERRILNVALTKSQVKESPDILTDRPVSRQMQSDLYGYYGWDPYWGGGMYGYGPYTDGMYGGGLGLLPYRQPGGLREGGYDDLALEDGDPHLRSSAEVIGYHVHASDGSIGHVEDFLIDSTGWGIRYLIVDTKNWWFGKHVLISPYAVKKVDWFEHEIRLDIGREKVKASPPWDPVDEVNQAYEQRLHSHYDWPGYGW